MSDFKEIIRYTVKYNTRIKGITTVLKNVLGPCGFCYSKTEHDGRYFTISDTPEILEFYYDKKLHLEDPHCSHPDLIRSGYLLTPDLHELPHLKSFYNDLFINYIFIIVQSNGLSVESFYFDTFLGNKNKPSIFLENLDLFFQFISYFKREARPILEAMHKDGFNIKEAKGQAFLAQNQPSPLFRKDQNIEKLLKIMTPLSHQEKRCLQLYKQGYSAQATAAIMGISQRTVESYFESIKNKLGCSTKSELLKWA